MGKNIKELSDAEFGAATAHGVTLVDFWAPWCGPCRMQTPILEEVAAEIGAQATIAKINVDEHQQSAARHGVQGIPTLILFKDGKPVGKYVGLQNKQALLSALRSAVGQAVS